MSPIFSTKLSDKEKTSTTLSQLQSSSLIPLGQICNDACTGILNKKKLIAIKDANIQCKYDTKEIILEGTRDGIDGLRDIPIPNVVISH